MSENYEIRKKIAIKGNMQIIQLETKNGKNNEIMNKAFNYFVQELRCGVNLLNAKRDTQRKFGIEIDFDTVFPNDDFHISTLQIRVD